MEEVSAVEKVVIEEKSREVVADQMEPQVLRESEEGLVEKDVMATRVEKHHQVPIIQKHQSEVVHEHHQPVIHEHHRDIVHEHHQAVIHEYI